MCASGRPEWSRDSMVVCIEQMKGSPNCRIQNGKMVQEVMSRVQSIALPIRTIRWMKWKWRLEGTVAEWPMWVEWIDNTTEWRLKQIPQPGVSEFVRRVR